MDINVAMRAYCRAFGNRPDSLREQSAGCPEADLVAVTKRIDNLEHKLYDLISTTAGRGQLAPKVIDDLARTYLASHAPDVNEFGFGALMHWVGYMAWHEGYVSSFDSPLGALPRDIVINALTSEDWPQIRAIYLDGLATGQATFETEAPHWEEWDAGHSPSCRLAARRDDVALGWAALSPVSSRPCYTGVAEASVYVAAAHRRDGIGRALLRALVEESERRGFWTLQGATFPENAASLRLQASCGFRIVGHRERISQLRGVWKNTVFTERRSKVVSPT